MFLTSTVLLVILSYQSTSFVRQVTLHLSTTFIMLHLNHPLQKFNVVLEGQTENVDIQELPGFLALKLDIEPRGKKSNVT